MNVKKMPKVAGPRAWKRLGIKILIIYCQCQARSPIFWLICSNFVENIVSQRRTRENSLRVDGLLILAEFLEKAGHAWN